MRGPSSSWRTPGGGLRPTWESILRKSRRRSGKPRASCRGRIFPPGVTTRYLALERKRAAAETTTPDCTFEKCMAAVRARRSIATTWLAGVRSTPSAPAVAAGEAAADVTPAQAALAAEVSAEAAAGVEVGDAPASKIASAGAEASARPSSAAASPAAAEVLGNDSSAEAASDERPLPVSEGGAR